MAEQILRAIDPGSNPGARFVSNDQTGGFMRAFEEHHVATIKNNEAVCLDTHVGLLIPTGPRVVI